MTNFILIITDQMRGDCLGADGHPVLETLNLDHLAALGTRFRCAYSAVPSCLPARATLWSGQHQWHTGVLGMGRGQGPIPNDFAHTLAGEFTAAGYRTHLVGKGHFQPQRTLMGFETTELDESGRMAESDHRRWFAAHAPAGVTPDDHGIDWNSWHARPWHTAEHLHPTAWTMMRSLDFLQQRDPNRPFFLTISFARPHSPYVPPPYYFQRYEQGETPSPHLGLWSTMHDDPSEAANANAWRGRMTSAQIHRARAGYYGEIAFIDTQIGRLLNWLRRTGLAEETWLLFTSDHGDMLGDHNLWRKTYAYEGSSRVPFIVTPPQPKGQSFIESCALTRAVADEVVELRDIMPTLLDAAGLPIPATVDGRSVLPLLQDAVADWRAYIHGEHCTCYHPDQEMHYVTDGKRKLIWLPRLDQQQFFDLEADPGECNDLMSEPTRQAEIGTWRGYLAAELAARECGWVQDGDLCCPTDEPLLSAFRHQRWLGP
ncbi:MAG TPA: arylsulfatase [Caldilineaceae bacterium]|nr:arylsulfatase [Caldilineaceae bacterium]